MILISLSRLDKREILKMLSIVLTAVMLCLPYEAQTMEIENPNERIPNLTHKFANLKVNESHDLIYELLTLKAEYLGEDLHTEIEKIKDQVYSTVTDQDIKDFAEKYEIEEIPNSEQKFSEEKYKKNLQSGQQSNFIENRNKEKTINFYIEIYFDDKQGARNLDLLMASAYYPKEYWLFPYGNYNYILSNQSQLAYSIRYNHPLASSRISQNVCRLDEFYKDQHYKNLDEAPDLGSQDEEDDYESIVPRDFLDKEEVEDNTKLQSISLKLFVSKIIWNKECFKGNKAKAIEYIKSLDTKTSK